jgi:hypothetical protein
MGRTYALADCWARRCLIILGALISVATAASSQAWVPPAGVGAVNLIFQDVDHTGHLLDDGTFLPGYESASQGLLLEADYAVTDRFSITAGIAYIRAKYLGPEPSFFGLPVDDCFCWNRDWQDAYITARYNLLNGTFALTPSVSYLFPTHDYDYFGEAVVGRNLRETRIAIDAGQRLDVISPRLSVSGRYSYAFVEEVLGLPNDRSNMAVSFGFLFTRKLSASVDFYWQRSHGGLKSTEFVTEEQWLQFDRLLKDNSFHFGGSIAYSFPRVDLFASYIKFESGTDTHTGRAITFGISWPFQL